MSINLKIKFALFGVLISTVGLSAPCADFLKCQSILETMSRVTDYQLANPNHPTTDWTNGALYAGVFATYQATGDQKYLQSLKTILGAVGFQPGPRLRHADDLAITQTYMDLYSQFGDVSMLKPSQDRWDKILEQPQSGRDDWWWCDALFMAPPAMAMLSNITGDPRYLQAMNAMFWDSYDFLYDPFSSLFFRDSSFFNLRERNGEKIFWSRGNGWVVGGLVRILKSLPQTYPERWRYEALLREMLTKIVRLQQEDGFWRPSLLDPNSTPAGESSGTGFYLYGLAYGLHSGILNGEEFVQAAHRAWGALYKAVDISGRLGWVQPIGYRPVPVRFEDSDVFGTGAMLLGSGEYLVMQQSLAAHMP